MNAVRDLLTGVILVFIRCAPNEKAWTFRDVLLAMLYEPYLHFLMQLERTREDEAFPIVSRLRNNYLNAQKGDVRTIGNIRATISAKLSIYEPIAATWADAAEKKRTFSLKQWVLKGCQDTLVLGNDESARAAIDAVNQAIFKRATELLLAQREATKEERAGGENQTWFFLDEVKEAGKLDGLSRLLTKGRSKGACVVLGFQDIDGMRSVYDESIANEICGQCGIIAVLRLNSPTTAEWASDLFGRRLALSRSSNQSVDSEGGVKRSKDRGEDERPYLYTSDFLYLPPTGLDTGLSGFFRSPNPNFSPEEGFDAHLSWDEVDTLKPAEVNFPAGAWRSARRTIPPSKHYLQPWDKRDWKRLGFDTLVPEVISWNTEEMPAQQSSGGERAKQNMPKDLPGKGKNSIFASDAVRPVDDIGR